MLRRSASPRVFDRGLQLSGREDGRTAWARKATGRGASRSNSKEATRQPGAHSLRQQERSDTFVRAFNAERPREALDMKCPAELYLASSRRYDGLPELIHPFHDLTLASTGNRRNTDDIGKARQSHWSTKPCGQWRGERAQAWWRRMWRLIFSA